MLESFLYYLKTQWFILEHYKQEHPFAPPICRPVTGAWSSEVNSLLLNSLSPQPPHMSSDNFNDSFFVCEVKTWGHRVYFHTWSMAWVTQKKKKKKGWTQISADVQNLQLWSKETGSQKQMQSHEPRPSKTAAPLTCGDCPCGPLQPPGKNHEVERRMI